jgi:hypothetical protein
MTGDIACTREMEHAKLSSQYVKGRYNLGKVL